MNVAGQLAEAAPVTESRIAEVQSGTWSGPPDPVTLPSPPSGVQRLPVPETTPPSPCNCSPAAAPGVAIGDDPPQAQNARNARLAGRMERRQASAGPAPPCQTAAPRLCTAMPLLMHAFANPDNRVGLTRVCSSGRGRRPGAQFSREVAHHWTFGR